MLRETGLALCRGVFGAMLSGTIPTEARLLTALDQLWLDRLGAHTLSLQNQPRSQHVAEQRALLCLACKVKQRTCGKAVQMRLFSLTARMQR